MNEVYRQGIVAQRLNKPKTSNPYPKLSPARQDWHSGWMDGYVKNCNKNAPQTREYKVIVDPNYEKSLEEDRKRAEAYRDWEDRGEPVGW